jgi:hypothetical protein
VGYQFLDDSAWAEEISEETSREEYQNAEIQILDDTLLTSKEYNYDTATWDIQGDPQIYRGRARIIPVRWGTETGGESQANSTTLKAVRVQIPRIGLDASVYGEGLYGVGPYGYVTGSGAATDGRVRRNAKVLILSCPRNTSLEGRVATITSDLQGSMSATRTFEAAIDIDAEMPNA